MCVQGRHHALYLDLLTVARTLTPQVGEFRSHSLSANEWKIRNDAIRNNPRIQRILKHVQGKPDAQRQHSGFIGIIRYHFGDRLAAKRMVKRQDATGAIGRKYARHPLFAGHEKARDRKGDKAFVKIQNGALRSEWESFATTAGAGGLREAFQYFAKKGGRAMPHFRPSRLDPLQVDGQLLLKASERAEALVSCFAGKLSADGGDFQAGRESSPE